jgi:hypothetical protein
MEFYYFVLFGVSIAIILCGIGYFLASNNKNVDNVAKVIFFGFALLVGTIVAYSIQYGSNSGDKDNKWV